MKLQIDISFIWWLEVGLGDIKANHSQSELYKATKVFATYNCSKLDLYYHWIDLQNTFTGGDGEGWGWLGVLSPNFN